MILVRETSQGLIVIRFQYVTRASGVEAAVSVPDQDGWAGTGDTAHWVEHTNEDDRPLWEVIAEVASLPPIEAQQLADSALRELHERGGDESDMTRWEWAKAFGMFSGILGFAWVAIVAVLAGIVWLAIQLL